MYLDKGIEKTIDNKNDLVKEVPLAPCKTRKMTKKEMAEIKRRYGAVNTKRCTRCGKEKPSSEFLGDNGYGGTYTKKAGDVCKECLKGAAKK